MSSVSGTSGTSQSSGTLGNQPPVSFPGVASGIDYDAIIEKYTAETLAQEKPTQTQIQNLNNQNTAVLKITNLIGAVQDTLENLSDPTIFGAFKATVSNVANGSPAATVTQVAGQTPIAGTYTIDSQTLATSTTVTNNTTANGTVNAGVALSGAGFAITPSNGTAANGKFTINGQQFNYDVNSTTLTQIVTQLNTILSSTGGSATLNANGTVTLTGVTSLGSGGDSGNLEQILKLDTAQIVGGTVTSSSNIGGINQYSVFSQNNNAGFATAVTSGTFTINGVQFTVNTATDTLANLITEINSSSAGVTAVYNSQTSSLVLTSKTPGPQSILLGAGSDTSNFLSAAGLSNGTTTSGTQASLTYTDSGGNHTVYSATNDFNSVIPGEDITITQTVAAGNPYTITVATDPSQAETSINAFVKAYNAAIQELNKDLQAPTVTSGTDASTGTATASSSGGGVLYGNYQIESLRDQLVNLVSGFVPVNSTQYNSLASIGLLLDTSSTTVGASDSDSSTSADSDATNSLNNSFTVTGGTSGQLAALDTTTFEAAYAANPTAVQNLFTQIPTLTPGSNPQPQTGSPYGFAYQFGSALANIDGLTTFLKSNVITPASIGDVLLTSVTQSNTQQIDSLEQQIALINQEATQQADRLRAQFTASESQIAELQALQAQIAAIGH